MKRAFLGAFSGLLFVGCLALAAHTPSFSLGAITGDITCPGVAACLVGRVLGAKPPTVSIASYGAVAGVNTTAAATANVSAFNQAFAASPNVYCPDGRTFYVGGMVTLPTSARSLTGACKVVAGVGFTNRTLAVFAGDRQASLRIAGIEADADLTAFPGTAGFRFTNGTKSLFDAVRATAGFGIVDIGSTGTVISRSYVADYNVGGILAANETGVKIDANEVHASRAYFRQQNGQSNSVGHCIQIAGGQFGTASNNSVFKCGYAFGVSVAGANDNSTQATNMSVVGNHTFGTRAEGINLTTAKDFVVSSNDVAFDGDTTDFGIALATSSLGLVTANKVTGSCKAGTAIAGGSTISIFGNEYLNVGSCVGRTANLTASADTNGVLTVTGITSGPIGWFDGVTGTGIPAGATIRPYGTNGTTGIGGVGTYQLSAAPSAAVPSEPMTTSFSDPDHSTEGVLIYGLASQNVVGPNAVTDLFATPHLLFAQGELAAGGPPSNNTFVPASTHGAIGNTLVIGTGSRRADLRRSSP